MTDAVAGTTAGAEAVVVARLRALAARAGGWDRADPYVLHYLISHAEQAVGAETDAAMSPLADLLDDAQFAARAEATRLARAAIRFRGRINRPVARLVERCVHEFSGLQPADRLGLLGLVAAQDGLGGAPSSPRWQAAWASWLPSSAHVVLPGHQGGVSGVAFSALEEHRNEKSR